MDTPDYDGAIALALLRKAEEAGNAEAIYALGTWHLFGKHVRKDLKKATSYLERASSLDHPDAAYDLAVSYERGAGVAKDVAKAFSLYMKAALLGERQSTYEVGRCFYWGIGTNADRQVANVWFDAFERLEKHGKIAANSKRLVRKQTFSGT